MSWIDRHSVTCSRCGQLADERETIEDLHEGEMHRACKPEPWKALLTADVTAFQLAMASHDPDEGYRPADIIAPKGSVVTIVAVEGNLVEVCDFANDPFAQGFVEIDFLTEIKESADA